MIDPRELREDEIRYRRRGKYALAIQCQRQAEMIESGDNSDYGIYRWFDRGAIPEVEFGVAECVTAFRLPSGLMWVLTDDQVFNVFEITFRRLGLRGKDLIQIGLQLMAEERLVPRQIP